MVDTKRTYILDCCACNLIDESSYEALLFHQQNTQQRINNLKRELKIRSISDSINCCVSSIYRISQEVMDKQELLPQYRMNRNGWVFEQFPISDYILELFVGYSNDSKFYKVT